MNIDQFVQFLQENTHIDQAIDQKMVAYAKRHSSIILEGRLTPHMLQRQNIPAYKILLTAPLDVSAARLAMRENIDVQDAKQLIIKRDTSDRDRYLDLYDIDIHSQDIFDCIIDTSMLDVEEVFHIAVEKLKIENF